VLERASKIATGNIFVVEMLPAPDQLLIEESYSDSQNKVASAIMVRFPVDEGALAMARRVAPMLFQ
jgi:hypothetical protein